MNDVQKAATDRANEIMRPAQELYDERCRLWRLSCDLPLRDLRRLNQLLAKLSHDDLRQIARFAEGLAEWHDLEQSLSGASQDGSQEPQAAAAAQAADDFGA